MSDSEIDAAVAALQATIEWLLSMKRPRAPAATSGQYIKPCEATRICGRSESQIRRDCENHPVDSGGFGLRFGGRWLIEEARYIEMRGNARLRR
jgi:hypothetical protein